MNDLILNKIIDGQLPKATLLVLGVLDACPDKTYTHKQAALAQDAGISRMWTTYILSKLQKEGLIKKIKKNGKTIAIRLEGGSNA